jgi:hypothetical protein
MRKASREMDAAFALEVFTIYNIDIVVNGCLVGWAASKRLNEK